MARINTTGSFDIAGAQASVDADSKKDYPTTALGWNKKFQAGMDNLTPDQITKGIAALKSSGSGALAAVGTSYETQNAVNTQKGLAKQEYGSDARRQLAENLTQIRRGAAQRGLSNSGIRAGAEQEVKSQTAGQLADYTARVNQAAADKLSGLSQERANIGLQKYQMAADQSAQAYQQALAKNAQQRSMASNIGGALGSLGGAVAGNYLGKKE